MLRKLTRASGKLTLGFVAVAALCLTNSAFAQAPISCVAQPVDIPALHDNGVTERIGDIKIFCAGGTPTPAGSPVPHFNLQVFTSPPINITSRILGGDVSEALVLFDDPAPAAQSICGSLSTPADSVPVGSCSLLGTGNGIGTYSGAAKNGATPGRPNAFVGRTVGPASIIFNNLPFDPPGNSDVRIMRLVNIRINASQVNNPRGKATALNLVISTASGNDATIQVPLGNSVPTVGIVQTPMDFSVSGATFLQCESQNYSGNSPASPVTPQLSLKFTERYQAAFRRRSAAVAVSSDAVPAPSESNDPNNFASSDTESGFYKFPNGSSWNLSQLGLAAPASLDKAGLADAGTRLLARFKNVPSGVRVYAGNHGQLIQLNNPNSPVTGDVHATVANPNGEGTFSSAGPTGGLSEITPGNATATWEVISTNTNVLESVTIPIAVAYLSADGSRPRSGPVVAGGQLAPLSTSATASATAAIPRFAVDVTNDSQQLFTISPGPCASAPGPVTLTLAVNPPGAGAIGISGPTCASTCSVVFNAASVPIYTAAPAPGFVFNGWSGACSAAAGPCTPFLDGTTPLTANFINTSTGTLTLGVKSGPSNARVWPLLFAGTFRSSVLVYSFSIIQTAGAACTPVVKEHPLTNYENGFTIALTTDFTSCASNARFRLIVPYSVDSNFMNLTVNNQFQ